MPKKLGKTVTAHYTREDLPKSEKHIKTLQDLRTTDNKIMTLAQFKVKYGTEPQVTNFSGFRSTIVKTKITLNNDKQKDYYNNFRHFVISRKGTKRFRKALSIDRETLMGEKFKIVRTWHSKLPDQYLGDYWNKPFAGWPKLPVPPEHKDLQLRIINRVLGCGHQLCKHNRGHDTRCRFCVLKGKVSEETIEHLFIDCPVTKAINNGLEGWAPLQNKGFKATYAELLLWDERDTKLEEYFINTIHVFIKKYIWNTRMNNSLPSLTKAKSAIQFYAARASAHLDRVDKPNPFVELVEANVLD